jgi:DNA-binding NtrC family response regulator
VEDFKDFVPETLEDVYRRLALKTLAYFDGNKTQTAQSMGITLKTLYNKLHDWGIMDEHRNFWRKDVVKKAAEGDPVLHPGQAPVV